MSPGKVVCVGPPTLDFIFDPIVAGLRQLAHEVVHYTDYSHFERDCTAVLASLNTETRGMLDLNRLRLMKPDAALINTARGGIIDEQALAQIARERPGLRIALDTFAQEPLARESPLRTLPNAILTPHAIGHTQESLAALPPAAIGNPSAYSGKLKTNTVAPRRRSPVSSISTSTVGKR